VFLQRVNAARTFLVLLTVLVVYPNEAAFAAEGSITKTTAPGPVLILSNSDTYPGVGFSNFFVNASDFPAGTLIDPKQLVGIEWSTTYYPQTLKDNVRLCYFRPFSAQEYCRDIAPNSLGVLTDFNELSFGNGSKVTIYHSVLGGTRPYARPAGVDVVKFKYRY
jgi:hypothetical protein